MSCLQTVSELKKTKQKQNTKKTPKDKTKDTVDV